VIELVTVIVPPSPEELALDPEDDIPFHLERRAVPVIEPVASCQNFALAGVLDAGARAEKKSPSRTLLPAADRGRITVQPAASSGRRRCRGRRSLPTDTTARCGEKLFFRGRMVALPG
jgi:hypothetical protein